MHFVRWTNTIRLKVKTNLLLFSHGLSSALMVSYIYCIYFFLSRGITGECPLFFNELENDDKIVSFKKGIFIQKWNFPFDSSDDMFPFHAFLALSLSLSLSSFPSFLSFLHCFRTIIWEISYKIYWKHYRFNSYALLWVSVNFFSFSLSRSIFLFRMPECSNWSEQRLKFKTNICFLHFILAFVWIIIWRFHIETHTFF